MADRCNICRLAGGRHRLDCPRLATGDVTFAPTPTPTDRLLAACRKLKAARDEQRQRVRDLQAMAAEARRTGKPGDIPVWDVSDAVEEIFNTAEEICEAMEEVDHG